MENEQGHLSQFSQPDLLDADAGFEQQFTYATQGQRFVNWLIDNLLVRFGLSYLVGMGVGFIMSLISPQLLYDIVKDEGSVEFYLLAYLIGALTYIFYYTLCEKLFRGYTLGKLVSGTRAIRQDGAELTFKDAILRSLSRIVPFEVFSGFNTLTCHDRWTHTMVVKAR